MKLLLLQYTGCPIAVKKTLPMLSLLNWNGAPSCMAYHAILKLTEDT